MISTPNAGVILSGCYTWSLSTSTLGLGELKDLLRILIQIITVHRIVHIGHLNHNVVFLPVFLSLSPELGQFLFHSLRIDRV